MIAGAGDEVELKLEMTPEAADALETGDLFGGGPEIIRQRAIYFDTPDHALAGAGLSLRVRRDGLRRVQTIKVDGAAAAGVFVRSEWERDVDDDNFVVDDTTPIPALLADKVGEIAPLFTVENERRQWNGGTIEISLDRGRVIAGEREAPLCEVELEQKGGDPAALFAMARRIDAIAPVHLGVLSKAERGYRLLGPAPAAIKAGSIKLASGMNAARAFQEIARACLGQFRLNVPLVLDHRDAAALHQSRVALRRLRSALSMHKPLFRDGRAVALKDELRWLAGEMGKARDLDVLIDRAGDGALADRLLKVRGDAYANAVAALESARARALMIDTVEWIETGDWLSDRKRRDRRELPAGLFAARALDRLRRRVKKDGRHLAKLGDEARHELRKDAKKLRYAAEFFAALNGRKRKRRRHKRFVSTLAALQDKLGALNDLATAPELLRRLDLADDPRAIALLGADRTEDLIDAAAEAHDALVDAKPFWR